MNAASEEDWRAALPSIISARLGRNRRVRRALPGGGRLHVDRLLPFLCLYRWPAGDPPTGSKQLATTQAAYLIAPDEPAQDDLLLAAIETIGLTAAATLGGFLVIELCEYSRKESAGVPLQPEFTLWRSSASATAAPTDAIAASLRDMDLDGQRAVVELGDQRAWPGRSWLVESEVVTSGRFHWIGIGFVPVHRGAQGELFPQVLLDLQSSSSEALLAGAFEFARRSTSPAPSHRHQLGRRALVRNAYQVDRHLARVADSFEFLRLVTPWNAEHVWQEFRDSGFRHVPRFRYHPLSLDPETIKRTLYDIPIENVEDITLSRLYRERQEELDRQITMLRDRGRESFFYGSLQLYGGVDDELYEQALALLARLPADDADDSGDDLVSAQTLIDLARREAAEYRGSWPSLPLRTEMRDDLLAGVMVSKDRLLVARGLSVPRARVEALLQHEVGTHLLTYFNGRAQRLRLLYVGLAGYEAFQEGLAVAAEYLVGGLDRWRLRLLAGRVVACRALVDRASLKEAFDELVQRHGFSARTAFTITARVYRGGGLTKDAIYLKGLRQALHHLSTSENPDLLFAGKIGAQHVPVIEELARRGVLAPIPLHPRYFERPHVQQRLSRIREGLTLADLPAQAKVEHAA
jgi:uncharacterized protein (TIGR02421 family)